MNYVALCFSTDGDLASLKFGETRITATFDDLQTATRLSRAMIAPALQQLERYELITKEGSHQRRRYALTFEQRWFKLPCKSIVRQGVLQPFDKFTLRSKVELHAMKLYLYLAAVRSNERPYSLASYEKIHERIGIPENDIRKAIIILTTSGLLQNSDRTVEDSGDGKRVYGPNKYFLTGHSALIRAPIADSDEVALDDEQISDTTLKDEL